MTTCSWATASSCASPSPTRPRRRCDAASTTPPSTYLPHRRVQSPVPARPPRLRGVSRATPRAAARAADARPRSLQVVQRHLRPPVRRPRPLLRRRPDSGATCAPATCSRATAARSSWSLQGGRPRRGDAPCAARAPRGPGAAVVRRRHQHQPDGECGRRVALGPRAGRRTGAAARARRRAALLAKRDGRNRVCGT